ncbi:MAG: deoxynucleoside kinase [Candidatus Gottesmanbacteria bacterium]|nr:deoxynucleoside kinase [Candidatus Gottesmanbacteria bacterium]
MNHNYVAVIGTMGVGKSTAAEVLAKGLNFQLFPEQFTDNPFLSKYYNDDPHLWSYKSQTKFLLDIIDQTHLITQQNNHTSVIQDSYIGQYVYSYAYAQYKLGYMSKDEWKQYCQTKKDYGKGLKRPNLLVYLWAPVPVCIDRILKRDRSFEKADQAYVELLDSSLYGWVSTQKLIQVLKVKTDTYDIAHDREVQHDFVENVRVALKVVNNTQ